MSTRIDSNHMIFLIVWIAIGVVSTAFIYLNKNVALKRKTYPMLVIGASALFGIYVSTRLDFSQTFSWVFMAIFLVISGLNLKAMKFCSACGATNRIHNPLSRAEHCSKCGAKLDE